MEYILDYSVYNVLKYKVLIMFKFIRYVRVMKIFIYGIWLLWKFRFIYIVMD